MSDDGEQSVSSLFITANVGSIFEDHEHMLLTWINELIELIKRISPKIIALHCQEVGGKNYENSMKHVEHFIQMILANDVIHTNYDKIRIYLDEDYSSKEHFTALGNIYMIHESINNIKYYDFHQCVYINVDRGQQIYAGNIESISTINKAKFPQHFFPECKWSRKGYMRTRWLINNTINVDLINVHLFHDESNFVAMEEYPSRYCLNRRRALQYILEQITNDQHTNIPYFIFGDFNFRTDTNSVIKKLTDGLITNRIQHSNDGNKTKLQYFNDDQQLILTVGKKEFVHKQHQNVFLNDDNHISNNECREQHEHEHISWLKSMDKELNAFNSILYEYPITFPPSYPFVEKTLITNDADADDKISLYMHTRCPSWCDRILISNTAKSIIDDNVMHIEYNMIGLNQCMGDHKPIYLSIQLISTSNSNNNCNKIEGILKYNNFHFHLNACKNIIVHNDNDNDNDKQQQQQYKEYYRKQSSSSSSNVQIHITDYTRTLTSSSSSSSPSPSLSMSNINRMQYYNNNNIDYNLLYNNYTKDQLSHEPYTPDTESIESYSPITTTNINVVNTLISTTTTTTISVSSGAISPTLLTSRLENILKEQQQHVNNDNDDNVNDDDECNSNNVLLSSVLNINQRIESFNNINNSNDNNNLFIPKLKYKICCCQIL